MQICFEDRDHYVDHLHILTPLKLKKIIQSQDIMQHKEKHLKHDHDKCSLFEVEVQQDMLNEVEDINIYYLQKLLNV